MYKATYNLTFGENQVEKNEANRKSKEIVSRMPNTKVSMRSGGRNILQVQGRPRSLDTDYNSKPKPFLTPYSADNSDNPAFRPVLPLTHKGGESGMAYNKSPRPFRKLADDGNQPRATSYPSYSTQKKPPEMGKSYLPERKKSGSGPQPTWTQRQASMGSSSTERLGSDFNSQGIRKSSDERSPGLDLISKQSQAPLARELSSESPKPPWATSGRETSPVRPPPLRSPRKHETSPGSPKPPWSPVRKDVKEQSPAKEPSWSQSSQNKDTRGQSPVIEPPWAKTRDPSPKDNQLTQSKPGRDSSPIPPWAKKRDPSPKDYQSTRSKSGRDASPAKENRPPWSTGRNNRDNSPSKDPRPPWSVTVSARDSSPKERKLSAGKGQSPAKDQRSGVREPSPRGKRPQWPTEPRDPSPSKEVRSPGGRGQSPQKTQWSPGGRGTSPGKEQRVPWSPGGRGTSPAKDVRPPWMMQPGQDYNQKSDNKPRSRGTSPSKDYKPPWAVHVRDQSSVSHPPPRSPRVRPQSPARLNQVRDPRGQSPAKQVKTQWCYPSEEENSQKGPIKRTQLASDQTPPHLPPAGQGSPRMSRSQKTKETNQEHRRNSPQRPSPKRSPPQMSYNNREIEGSNQGNVHQQDQPSYARQEDRQASSQGQHQTSRHQYKEREQSSFEQPNVGRNRSRSRGRQQQNLPQTEIKDVKRVLAEESNRDDHLSERDDEVERILSGILDTTSPARKGKEPGYPTQDKHYDQSQGHAFEPYGRQGSLEGNPQQPHSHFYQSLQVRPAQGDHQASQHPSHQSHIPPESASEPKKVLLKSVSNPDQMSFAAIEDQQADERSQKEQSPRTRREAFARSKTFQPDLSSDHDLSDTGHVERKLSRGKMPQVTSRSLSSDSGTAHELTVYQSEGESQPKSPKAYKPAPTLTFINGMPCEVKSAPTKSPRMRRHVDQSQIQRTKSLDAEVYCEQVKSLESGGEVDDACQSDSKLSPPRYAHSRANKERSHVSPNRYSGAYDNVHSADPQVPLGGSDRTDGAQTDITAPPAYGDQQEPDELSESQGNPAVFIDTQCYGESGDLQSYGGSFSLLQPPEDDESMRKSPSVREMAAERETAEAAHREECHYKKKKLYARKMSMPIHSQTEKVMVRKMSLEESIPSADLTSGSETDDRSQRATPIQPQVQDLMAFRMRTSKFRHVFGEAYKKDKSYENVRITKNQHDSMFCAVNPKFLAVVVESAGGGAFMVLPTKQVGRIDINAPKVCGHAGAVLDIKWSPFNDHQIASCSDDATIKVWEIPEDGLRENLTEWIVDLHGHQRRIGYIEWHPTAEHILLSAGFDYNVILWNIETAEPINIITCHTDTIFSLSWNRDGSLFATTSKDKKLRVIDPRSGRVVSEGAGHVGPKSSKVVFLGDSMRLFTTGFSRMSERQFGIWDVNDLSKPLKLESIDSSSGVLLPHYDIDNKVMFLIGKGDGNIRYYEIVNEAPYCHFLNAYLSGQPQKGFGVMPKRGVDLTKCEIVRFYKLLSSKPLVEPISMRVPRKSEMFQEDIFPPTASSIPSLSAIEWINGQNRDPILVSLKDGAMQPMNTPTITTYKAVSRSLLNNNDTQPTQEPLEPEHIPASVRNIKKLSISEDRIPNLDEVLEGKVLYEDDPKRKRESVHERISAFETIAEPIRPSPPPPMLSNTVRQVSIEKRTPPPSHWMSELPSNGLPKSDGEAIAMASEEGDPQSPDQSTLFETAADAGDDVDSEVFEKRAPPAWMYSAKPFSSKQSSYTVLPSQSPFEEKSIEIIDHTPALRSIERKRQWSDMSDEYDMDIPASDITRVRSESVREIIQKVEDDSFIYDPPSPVSKVHVKKVWTPKSPQSEEPPIENGLTPKTDPELRKAYFRQLEEIHSLKEQIMLKDKRIRQLEEELTILKECDDDGKPNESNC